jgi:hypothetical protein
VKAVADIFDWVFEHIRVERRAVRGLRRKIQAGIDVSSKIKLETSARLWRNTGGEKNKPVGNV